jgi:membrane protein implicated in regulation of membrane protease activity
MEGLITELVTNPGHIWLLVGALLVIVEMTLIPGAGFLFAGLAAFTVGVVVEVSWIDSDEVMSQMAAFLVLTGVWAAALWRPLKKWLKTSTDTPYSNVVGSHAVVEAPGLKKGKRGHVRWSDTTMKARLAADCPVDHVDEGTEVVIVEIKGTTLTVTMET